MKKLATTVEVSKVTKVSRPTLQHWIKTKRISVPAVKLVNGRAVRFSTEELIDQVRKLRGTLKPGPQNRRGKRLK